MQHHTRATPIHIATYSAASIGVEVQEQSLSDPGCRLFMVMVMVTVNDNSNCSGDGDGDGDNDGDNDKDRDGEMLTPHPPHSHCDTQHTRTPTAP